MGGRVRQAEGAAGGRAEDAHYTHPTEWELGAYREPRNTLGFSLALSNVILARRDWCSCDPLFIEE